MEGVEARRVGQVPTGVESFKWFPDGKRIAFVSWVWPELKAAAQAEALRAHKSRKESAYVTDEALYRFWDHHIPMGRVPHLHVMDIDTGKVRDLFEGSDWELSRAEPDAKTFDIAPDGRRIAFAFDNTYARDLADLGVPWGPAPATAPVSSRNGSARPPPPTPSASRCPSARRRAGAAASAGR